MKLYLISSPVVTYMYWKKRDGFLLFLGQESLGPESLVLKKIRGGEHALANSVMEESIVALPGV